jgi:predicted nuclease with TOPRIM domain
MDDDSQTTQEKTDDDKNVQTFTQSELDKIVAREKSKVKEKLGSQVAEFEDLKSKYESLAQKEKERAEADMSELEKAKAVISDLNNELTELKVKAADFDKERTLSRVLSNSKYAQLPRAYKNLVIASDDEDAVIESANKAVEEWQKDNQGTAQKTFGLP